MLKRLTAKNRELRDERIRLLTEKIQDVTGKDVNVVPEKSLTENDTVLEKVNVSKIMYFGFMLKIQRRSVQGSFLHC